MPQLPCIPQGSSRREFCRPKGAREVSGVLTEGDPAVQETSLFKQGQLLEQTGRDFEQPDPGFPQLRFAEEPPVLATELRLDLRMPGHETGQHGQITVDSLEIVSEKLVPVRYLVEGLFPADVEAQPCQVLLDLAVIPLQAGLTGHGLQGAHRFPVAAAEEPFQGGHGRQLGCQSIQVRASSGRLQIELGGEVFPLGPELLHRAAEDLERVLQLGRE